MNKQILVTFYNVLLKDITIYNKRLIYRSIDAFVWAGSSLLISHHIMPLFGITDPKYGIFTLIGNIAIWGLFEMLTSIGMFLGDLQGDRSINYYLSLPLPSYILFSEQALASAYKSMASSLLILPMGKLILGNYFILSTIHWPKFFIAFFIINIFYGFFTLFVASYVQDLSELTTVRSRIMFPLWFLGGFQFPWKMLYKVAPTLALCSLLNPIIYIMDGLRSTVLPTQDYLPFWHCISMLIFFSIVFGYLGIKKLQKRLDCI